MSVSEEGHPPIQSAEGPTVTFEITESGSGSELRTLCVHKQLLLECSDYFRAALLGEFQESVSQKLAVDNFSYQTMLNFINWLYFGRIPSDKERAMLAVVANYYNVTRLSEELVRFYHTIYPADDYNIPSFSEVAVLFKRMPAADPLLRLIVDLFIHMWSCVTEGDGETWGFDHHENCDEDEKRIIESRFRVPKQFWIRLAVRMSVMRDLYDQEFPDVESYLNIKE